MTLAPETADTLLWVGGILLIGVFLAIKLLQRRKFREERIDRRQLRRGREGRPDPDEAPDLAPMLRRTRLQILLAMVGIAALIFIGVMHLGSD